MKTVVGLFPNRAEAENAVRTLEMNGFARGEISIITSNERQEGGGAGGTATEDVGKRVATGAAVGGGVGLIAGLAALAIPGVGPVLAAGPLVTALTGAGVGAAVGGLAGALIEAGVPEDEAGMYAEGVRRGGTLVTVRVDDRRESDAAQTLRQQGAQNVREMGGAEGTKRRGTGRSIQDRSPDLRGAGSTMGPVEEGGSVTNPGEIFVLMDAEYRLDWESRYGTRDMPYERYEPAYRFGAEWGRDPRYSGRDWPAVEPEARREWESRGHGAWEDFKDAIRHGWEKIRGRR
jgi:hypothetical protein